MKSLLSRASLWSVMAVQAFARCMFYCFLIIVRLLPGTVYWSKKAPRCLSCRYLLHFRSSSDVGWDSYCIAGLLEYALHVPRVSEEPYRERCTCFKITTNVSAQLCLLSLYVGQKLVHWGLSTITSGTSLSSISPLLCHVQWWFMTIKIFMFINIYVFLLFLFWFINSFKTWIVQPSLTLWTMICKWKLTETISVYLWKWSSVVMCLLLVS